MTPNLRLTAANALLGTSRKIGEALGAELVVDVSEHSIEIGMGAPDKNSRAWDSEMFSSGQLFVAGYANPIKPRVRHHKTLDNPDTIDVVEKDDVDEPESDDGPHVELISSSRYRDYMRQDLISQMLTPTAQWRLLAYAVGALAILMIINVVISMAAAGAF